MKSDLVSCNLDGKTTEDVKPTINVKFYARNFSFKDLKKLKCYLDKKKITPQLLNNKLSYLPIKNLKKGIHKLKIRFKNKDSKKKEYSFRFTVGSSQREYSYFYGIPHSHTSYSSGKGTPLSAYKYASDQRLDFLMITDHFNDLKKMTNDSSSTTKWDKLKIQCKKFNKKQSKFLPLYGYEIKGYLGSHFNVLFSDDLISNLKNLKKLKEISTCNTNMMVSINHPSKKILKMDYDPQLDKIINLIEVGNGSPPNKYREYYDIYFKMLDIGWHLGAINSQDNHLENWGDTDNVTAVVTEKLSVNSFSEALKKRRVYSTESKSLKLKVLANNKWMGNSIPLSPQKDINIYIKAEDKHENIKKIEIYSNNGEIVFEQSYNSNIVELNKNFPSKSGDWFVVKVILSNNKSAISSAVYVI